MQHRAGHVPGATLAPHTRLPRLEERLSREATLLVHCATGARSAVASAYLASRGYDVRHVDDDWSAWVAAGRPVEKGAPDVEVVGAAHAED